MPQIQRLMGALCFARRGAASGLLGGGGGGGGKGSAAGAAGAGPYSELFQLEELWAALARDFVRQCCALLGQVGTGEVGAVGAGAVCTALAPPPGGPSACNCSFFHTFLSILSRNTRSFPLLQPHTHSISAHLAPRYFKSSTPTPTTAAPQAQDSPLLVTVAAGCAALPTLLKLASVRAVQPAAGLTAAGGAPGEEGQLPLEIPLGREFVFHSIFACPVSREQVGVRASGLACEPASLLGVPIGGVPLPAGWGLHGGDFVCEKGGCSTARRASAQRLLPATLCPPTPTPTPTLTPPHPAHLTLRRAAPATRPGCCRAGT